MAGSKLSLTSIVQDHLDTLVDARTHVRRRRDSVAQYGFPLLVGAVGATAFGVAGLAAPDPSGMLGGIAIFTGLMFGLATFVFQLRLTIGHDPRLTESAQLKHRVDELFSNVLYAVLVGLVGTVLCLVGFVAATYHVAGLIWFGVTTAALTHFVMVVAMCLKRLSRAYDKLKG